MPSSDEVLIKVAADVASAADSLMFLKEMFIGMAETMAEVTKKTEDAEPVQRSFWDTIMNGTAEGVAGATTWGNVMAKTLEDVTNKVGQAIKAFPQMIQAQADAGDAAAGMATRMGLSVDQLAELNYVSGQTSVPVQTMQRGLQNMSTQLQKSGSDARRMAESIGLVPDELAKMPPPQQIEALSKAFKANVAEADRAQAMYKLAGRQGQAMVGAINADMPEMRANFQAMGGDDNQARLAELGNRFDGLSKNLDVMRESAKRSLAVAVLPAINAVLETAPALGGWGILAVDAFMSVASTAGTMVGKLLLTEKGINGFFQANSKLFDAMKSGGKHVSDFGGKLASAFKNMPTATENLKGMQNALKGGADSAFGFAKGLGGFKDILPTIGKGLQSAGAGILSFGKGIADMAMKLPGFIASVS